MIVGDVVDLETAAVHTARSAVGATVTKAGLAVAGLSFVSPL